uniref:XRE family transcriptional regulator n=1 Tax=Fervidicoccus fontis TaxID=683846 RepID=A0A7J3ZM03_9CREN
MARRSIFELAYRYIEPSVRRQLAVELCRRGIPRGRVAEAIGISQSLLTRYLRGERGSRLDLTPYRDVVELVARLAEKALEARRVELDEGIYRIVLYFLSRRYFCNTHVALDRSINPATCRICPTLFGIGGEGGEHQSRTSPPIPAERGEP